MTSDTAEVIRTGPLTIRFLLEGNPSTGSPAIFEFSVPPGAKVPIAHSHDAYEETLYGLEGTLILTLDGKPTQLAPGDVLLIPRGVVHRFDNLHPTPAKTLAVITPGILGPGYFREVAAIVNAATQGPPDFAAIAATMKRHGLTPAP